MQNISNVLRTLAIAPVPEEALCSDCGYLLPEHPEYLALARARGYDENTAGTLSCRCTEKRRVALAKTKNDELQRWKFADLPAHTEGEDAKRFSNFEPRPGTEEGLKVARAFAAGEGKPLLVLASHPGCGKSHLLEAIGWHCLAQGKRVKYAYVPDLLGRLRPGGAGEGESAEDVLEEYRWADVLLLDDIGAESSTPWTEEKITGLVDERCRNGRRLAVATNLANRDAADTRLRSRLFDTQTGIVELAVLTCSDYRRQR